MTDLWVFSIVICINEHIASVVELSGNYDVVSSDFPPSIDSLTNRELDVLRLIAEGLSDREIAEELTLALETVKWYNKQIYSKLGVRNRTEAAAKSLEISFGGEEAPTSTAALPTHSLPDPNDVFCRAAR